MVDARRVLRVVRAVPGLRFRDLGVLCELPRARLRVVLCLLEQNELVRLEVESGRRGRLYLTPDALKKRLR